MEKIYLDYNATTPLHEEVVESMKPYLEIIFGNPSSNHWFGIQAKKAVEVARRQVADLLGCMPDEIIFTSGGTESNNHAIKGMAFANRSKGNHIIISSIEHPSVTEVCRYLETKGFEIGYLPVDKTGILIQDKLEELINPSTILISIMHANNEVGTIQPISKISEVAGKYKIKVHTDASQSIGKIPVNVNELGVDLLSVAGHKIYGPKGTGALYIKRGTQLEKLIHGADHEQDLRAGTENVLEIVGLGKACEIAKRDQGITEKHLHEMRDRLEAHLKRELPDIVINGNTDFRLPNTSNISFPGMDANTILSDLKDIAASTGSACHSTTHQFSPVLKAMDVPPHLSGGSIRFSTGRYTTKEEIDEAVTRIGKTCHRINPGNKKQPTPHISQATIRLTQYSHGLGCACKINPDTLRKILTKLPLPVDPDVLVSAQTSDDAAVYKISRDTAILNTVDFITPVVDDPYQFGAIAAANALSDIYAMGGDPLFALNIVGFPNDRLPQSVLENIIQGASDKAGEAGISILGGHSIDDTEPKFGMAVTGKAHPEKIITNSNGQPGDQIILTKPLGLGIITTGIKRNMVDKEVESTAIELMLSLNKQACEQMKKHSVNACSDVTGFGLLGHLMEITTASLVDAEIFTEKIPFLPKAIELAAANIIPGGTLSNLAYVQNTVEWSEGLSNNQRIILADAQTSGGLLICVPGKNAQGLLDDLHNAGITYAAIIGELKAKGTGKITVCM